MSCNKFKMFYYLPNQSELFCSPNVFETTDRKELNKAVSIACEKKYKIVKIVHITN